MKPPIFNYQDYEAAVKQYEETADRLSDVLRDNARLKAENEALKAKFDALTDDIRKEPICRICKHWNEEAHKYDGECEICGWFPWNDEETVPCIWEWRGVSE